MRVAETSVAEAWNRDQGPMYPHGTSSAERDDPLLQAVARVVDPHIRAIAAVGALPGWDQIDLFVPLSWWRAPVRRPSSTDPLHRRSVEPAAMAEIARAFGAVAPRNPPEFKRGFPKPWTPPSVIRSKDVDPNWRGQAPIRFSPLDGRRLAPDRPRPARDWAWMFHGFEDETHYETAFFWIHESGELSADYVLVGREPLRNGQRQVSYKTKPSERYDLEAGARCIQFVTAPGLKAMATYLGVKRRDIASVNALAARLRSV